MTADKALPESSPDMPLIEDIPIVLRLAETAEEVIEAQKCRYNVFYEEFGAIPSPEVAHEKRDFDTYDAYADHLILIDKSPHLKQDKIVGTYRLFRTERLPADLPFYTSHEFDITQLLNSGAKLLELGRSCVLPEYRTKYAMQRLWQGIAEYLSEHHIDLMFGCASLQGTDPSAVADQLAYLKYFHAPPEGLCPQAQPDCTKGLTFKAKDDLNARRVFASLPPLVKGYLRLGAYIGAGAYLDKDFNSIDICIVLPTHKVTSKYIKHYERHIDKDVVRESAFAKKFPNLTTDTDNV